MFASLQRFRWWQGAILGAVTGLALWQLNDVVDGWRTSTVVSGLSLPRFVRLAQSSGPPGSENDPLQDIVVHPRMERVQLVTARTRKLGTVEFNAPAPFVVPRALTSPPGRPDGLFDALKRLGNSDANRKAVAPPQTYGDVRDFLRAEAPATPWRYAWWEVPWINAALWIGSPLVTLGLLLPLGLWVLTRLGLVPPPPVVLGPPPAPVAAEPDPEPPLVDHDAVAAQLSDVTAALEQRLTTDAAAPADTAPAPFSEPAAAPAVLSGEPLQASPPAESESKAFDGGEYYPVHRRSRNK